ncbi:MULTISPECIES: hypothetical protein [unclassified Pseudomonas]
MFQRYSFIAGLSLLVLGVFAEPILAKDVYVSAYTRNDGTYVQGHYRSAPDGDFDNNWSTLGKVNPYTGEPGTLTSQYSDTAKEAAAETFEDDGESDPDNDL